MVYLKLLMLSVCLFCSSSYAQNKVLDSLRKEISKHPARDSGRVGLIMDYVVAAVNENTTMLLTYLDEIISISKELSFTTGLQSGYITAQIYYSDRGDFTKAMLYADSAFIYLNKDTAKKAKVRTAYLHSNLGGDYLKMGDYQQSVDHYTQAATLLEIYKPEQVATVYSGLGEAYEHLLQPEKAMEYDRKAIAVAEKQGNKSSIAKRYLNYIVRHINQQRFAEADVLLRKIEPVVKEVDQSFSSFLFYQNKGYVYQHQKNYAAAISSFKQADHYARLNDDVYQQLSILDPLTRCLIEAGNMKEAKMLLDTMLQKSIAYKMRFSQLSAYSGFAKWYTASGDHKTANAFLDKRLLLSDSIYSDEMKEKVAMAETRFRVQAKDNEIKILQVEKQNQQLRIHEKNVLNYILIGSAATLLVIMLLLYRNHRNKQQLQQQRIGELETEKQLTATEAVLKGEEQERTRLAKDLHDGLGGMLSGIKHSFNTMKGNLVMTPGNRQDFERGMDMLDSSIKEMRRVAHNMMPEVLVKYGLDTALRDFCIDINKSGALKVNYQSIGMEGVAIDQTVAIALYRVAQELLNNAIKHAGATNAIVQLSKTGGQLSLTVEDDGKGFDTTLAERAKGMGWNNIRNRVEFLKGKLDISSSPGNGCSVIVELDI